MLLMAVNLTHHLLALDLAVLFLIYLLILVRIISTIWWKRKLKLDEKESYPFPIYNQYI